MWVKVSADSGFTGQGFERPGGYFRLEDLSYVSVYGPAADSGLYHVAGQATSLGALIAFEPGYETPEAAQTALDKLLAKDGVAALTGGPK